MDGSMAKRRGAPVLIELLNPRSPRGAAAPPSEPPRARVVDDAGVQPPAPPAPAPPSAHAYGTSSDRPASRGGHELGTDGNGSLFIGRRPVASREPEPAPPEAQAEVSRQWAGAEEDPPESSEGPVLARPAWLGVHGRNLTVSFNALLFAVAGMLLLATVIWAVAFRFGQSREKAVWLERTGSGAAVEAGAGGEIAVKPGLITPGPDPIVTGAATPVGRTNQGGASSGKAAMPPSAGTKAPVETAPVKEAGSARAPGAGQVLGPDTDAAQAPAGGATRTGGSDAAPTAGSGAAPAPTGRPGGGSGEAGAAAQLTVGWNYLIAAVLPRPEAEAAAAFLTENGVRAAAVPTVDSGPALANNRVLCKVVILEGVSSAEWRSSDARRSKLEDTVRKLGRTWQRQHRGPANFADVYWEKRKG